MLLGCTDLWGMYVPRKTPFRIDLSAKWNLGYSDKDLTILKKKVTIGETYTMELKVSSTCDKEILIGFTSDAGFFSKAPGKAKDTIITVTDKWKGSGSNELRLENRADCGNTELTIHRITLVKGSNCPCFKTCSDGNYLSFLMNNKTDKTFKNLIMYKDNLSTLNDFS